MGNVNIFLDDDFENKFKEIKLILRARTNQETQQKIIEIAYKELKEGETSK